MPRQPPHVAEMEAFLAERGERLLRTAIALAGSREAGEDLLQTTLERLFGHWRQVHGDPEGYLRRTLAHLVAHVSRALAARPANTIVLVHDQFVQAHRGAGRDSGDVLGEHEHLSAGPHADRLARQQQPR